MTVLFTALALGFFGSFHCIGMCGPIALALPLGNRPALAKAGLILLYNLGRVLTYSVFGMISGFIGKAFFAAGYQQALSVAIGILLLAGVLLPPDHSIRRRFNGRLFSYFNSVKQALGRLFLQEQRGSLFVIGLLNGLLPCGLVYIAVSGAVAGGDPFKGALFMAMFGLGTLPMLFALPFIGQLAGTAARTKIRKAMPVVTGAVAVILILRGLNLGIPYLSPQFDKNTHAVAACHTEQPACCHKK